MPITGAHERLFRSYLESEEFYRYIRAICSKILAGLTTAREEQVEDAVMVVLARAWTARQDFQPPDPETDGQWRDAFRKWIARIARNHCIDLLRRRRELLTTDWEGIEPGETPMVAVTDDLALYSCLNRLATSDLAAYEALVLKHLEDMKWEQVATSLGISVSQARTRVKRAERQMRDCLDGVDSLEIASLEAQAVTAR